MKIHYLDDKHYLFGNKGACWSKEIHICKSGGGFGGTLCGTPTLSSNWAAIYEYKEDHGLCPKCKKIWEEDQAKTQ